jgi:hypothetical protein
LLSPLASTAGQEKQPHTFDPAEPPLPLTTMAGQEKLHNAVVSHHTVAISLCFILGGGAPILCIMIQPKEQEKQKEKP